MNTDFSKLLYDKYFSLKNRNIVILLKNGRLIKGVIFGFYRGDEDSDEPYIIKWHIIKNNTGRTPCIDPFGFIPGELINQSDIAEVYFLFDNSSLKFK